MQYQVYIKAEFLFDVMVEAASFNDAALLAMNRFRAKNGIENRMVKAFAPGDYIDGDSKVTSVYAQEE